MQGRGKRGEMETVCRVRTVMMPFDFLQTSPTHQLSMQEILLSAISVNLLHFQVQSSGLECLHTSHSAGWLFTSHHVDCILPFVVSCALPLEECYVDRSLVLG